MSSIKEDPKKLHKYIRSQLKVKPTICALENGNGLTETESEAAESLLNYFQSVFVKEDDGPIPECPVLVNEGDVLESVEFTPEVIKNELESLKENKSPGPDGISSTVLKKCAAELSRPLLMLFKKTMNEGQIPQDWKRARIVPIHKKGSKSKPENYRPVSLTSQVCKVMEKLVKKAIISHLQINDLLTRHQHGFISGKSCMTNLLEALEDWTTTTDEGIGLDILFLDFQKAFDSVPHKRLLAKLKTYGIDGRLLKWIQAFLHERKQQVSVGSGFSEWGLVTSGVPQGSVLGPVLFLVYINELPSLVQNSMKLFADDAKIYSTVRDSQDAKKLQDDLSVLEKWSKDWLLKLNPQKCKVMHCGAENEKADYFIKDADNASKKIQETQLEKDLGVFISNNLKPAQHCLKAASKGMRALRLMKTAFDKIDDTNFKVLFTTYVRPHLEYCIQAVGPYTAQDLKILEKGQRRATKLVKKIRNETYEERLRMLGLPSIEERIRRGDMIETYKLLTGKVNVEFNQFFELENQERTRGHHLKLKKKRATHASRLKFFSNRVVNPWNSLPKQVIEATTTNAFKNRLDKLHWTTLS